MPDNPMKMADALREIREKPVVDLYPTAARALDVSRSATYTAAKRGEIEVIKIGRLVKAVSAPLRAKLKMDEGR